RGGASARVRRRHAAAPRPLVTRTQAGARRRHAGLLRYAAGLPAASGFPAVRCPPLIPSPPRHALLPLLSLLLPLAAAEAAATVAPATAAATDGGSYLWELMAILLPLAFIIVFLLVLLHLLRRRFGLAGPDAPLSVVQVLPVGSRERIVVVRTRAGRAFAIGVSASAVTLVSMLDDDDLGPAAIAHAQMREDAVTTGLLPSLLQRLKVKRP